MLAFLPLIGMGKSITITKEQLLDKIKGGWAGQTIGCTYGGPTEFRYRGRIIPDEEQIKWPDGYIKWYFDNGPGLYDDIYMDLTFLEVLHRSGFETPVDSFALAFAHAGYMLWHANQAARYNILNGVMPPQSGHWKNNPHADDIDYQIEADYAGLIHPGLPNAVSALSDKIGHIMNYGDGWYGGVFVGAMYSQAFIYNDIKTIVTEALKTIPRKSNFYSCISDIIKWHEAYPNDWKRTWQLCQDKYADEKGCPEGVKNPLDIDASLNAAYIVIGLLYGEGDFDRTLEISTRCGQDSDCNPSSAGGVLGCMIGYNKIPQKWMANLHEAEHLNFAYTTMSLNDAYQYSYDLALKAIEKHGGKVADNLSIRLQKPKAVRLEQSFKGIKPTEVRDGNDITKLGAVAFQGKGIVVRAAVKSGNNDYVAQVEAVIDGKPVRTVKAPASYRHRTDELFWIYDLPEGSHTLQLRWLNPETDCSINCHRIVIYGAE